MSNHLTNVFVIKSKVCPVYTCDVEVKSDYDFTSYVAGETLQQAVSLETDYLRKLVISMEPVCNDATVIIQSVEKKDSKIRLHSEVMKRLLIGESI